jgi:hypothetical protein
VVFRNYEVMLGQTQLLCVELCHFVQWHIFVGYFPCYYFIKGVLNIRDTDIAAGKYSRLYGPINVFIFKIYNMG